MNGIAQCPTCGSRMIEEEFATHKCGIPRPSIRRVLDVLYDWWLSEKEPDGRFIAIMAKDGTLYRFAPSPKSDTQNGHRDKETMYRSVHCRPRLVSFCECRFLSGETVGVP